MREQAIKNIRKIWGYRCENWTSEEWEVIIKSELKVKTDILLPEDEAKIDMDATQKSIIKWAQNLHNYGCLNAHEFNNIKCRVALLKSPKIGVERKAKTINSICERLTELSKKIKVPTFA